MLARLAKTKAIVLPATAVKTDHADLTARTESIVNMSLRSVILPLADAHARVVVDYANGQRYICTPPKAPGPDAGGLAILNVVSGAFRCSKG